MTRKPSFDFFDAVIDLEPHEALTTHAYVVIKQSLAWQGGVLNRAEAETLEHDSEAHLPKEFPLPGSDLWTQKANSDVVILGSAYSRRANVTQMHVACSVGESWKRVAVFGKRTIEWSGSRVQISRAEPFEKVALVNENAYGGVDGRVPLPPTSSPWEMLEAVATYLGPYPRNPFGKGYYVVDEQFVGIEMPNLEDPQDLLTADRLIVRDPSAWHRQPLPFSFDWMSPVMFPRLAMQGQDPVLPPAGAQLAEVLRGYVPANYQNYQVPEVNARYYQEASLGMVFPFLAPGTPVSVRGMHPERDELKFQLPESPRVVFNIEGTSFPAPANLTSVVMRPDEERVSLVYLSRVELPRPFIPGIHKYIPVSALIDGQELRYDAPVPLRERIAKGPKGPPGRVNGVVYPNS